MSNNFTAQRGGGSFFTPAFHTSTHHNIFSPQDFFFFPGQPSSWSFLSWGEGEGQTVQLFIQVVSTFQLSCIHSKVQKVNPLTTFRSRASSVSSGCSTPSSASSSPSSESSSNVPSSSMSPFSPFHTCSTEQFWNQYRRRPPTTSMTKMLKKALTSRLPSRCQPEILISDAKRSVVLLLFLFLTLDSTVIFQREASREPRVPSRFAKPWKPISGSWEQLLERDDRDQDGQGGGEDNCHQDGQGGGEEVCEGARREVHEKKRCAFAQTRNHRLPPIRSWIALTKCQVCT